MTIRKQGQPGQRCGAATRKCRCGHHRKRHTPACGDCGCQAFDARPCRNPGRANGRCDFHGGKSLVGPAHPAWKDGRHSKFLPPPLAEQYRAGANDPNLLALRDEVVLVDMRIGQLIVALGETGNARLWKEAAARYDAIRAAKDQADLRLALVALKDVLDRGQTDAATWDELRELLDLRRRLVESEGRRLKDLHQMISTQDALRLMGLLLDSVVQNVSDNKAVAAINAQFLRLVGRRSDVEAGVRVND